MQATAKLIDRLHIKGLKIVIDLWAGNRITQKVVRFITLTRLSVLGFKMLLKGDRNLRLGSEGEEGNVREWGWEEFDLNGRSVPKRRSRSLRASSTFFHVFFFFFFFF